MWKHHDSTCFQFSLEPGWNQAPIRLRLVSAFQGIPAYNLKTTHEDGICASDVRSQKTLPVRLYLGC